MTNLLTMVITAYCSCSLCCGKNAKHGLTASGAKPKQGITIAAPRAIPIGSKVIIQGHTYTVQDRLAKKYDSRIDIYFSFHEEAKKFGIRTNQVRIITK